jgi:hypothetical protein
VANGQHEVSVLALDRAQNRADCAATVSVQN